jgi:hypothetical protein
MRCALLLGLLQLAHHAAAFVTPALLHAPAVSRASSRMHMTVPGVASTQLLAVDISSMHSTQFGSDQLTALGTTGIKEADQLGMYIICLQLLYSTFAINTVMHLAVDAATASTMYCSLAVFALGVCCRVALTPYM